MRRRLDGPALFAARLFLGGIFAFAGYAKLMEPAENFQYILRGYALFPEFLIIPVSYVLPWMEWLLGMFVITGYAPRQSSLALGFLSLGFAAAIILSGKLTGEAGSCGCFGEGGPQLDVRYVFMMDLVNAFLGMRLFGVREFPWSLDAALKKRAPGKS